MTTKLLAEVVEGACRFCGRSTELVCYRAPRGLSIQRVLTACPLCLTEGIDEAIGWKISRNVAQGMANRSIARKIRETYPRGRGPRPAAPTPS